MQGSDSRTATNIVDPWSITIHRRDGFLSQSRGCINRAKGYLSMLKKYWIASLAIMLRGAMVHAGYPLVPSQSITGTGYGSSVAIGNKIAVVGAEQDGNSAGAVYVFENNSQSWGQVARLIAPDRSSGDIFGRSVAVASNFIAVGAPFCNTGNVSNAGAVYLFERTGSGWIYNTKLYPPAGASQEAHFGNVVALSDDTLVVGEPHRANALTNEAGRVYIYSRSGSTWSYTQPFVYNGSQKAHFGSSVSVAGDSMAVGAPLLDVASVDDGAVFIFARSSGSWVLTGSTKSPTPEADGRFGAVLDINTNLLVVGAPGAIVNGKGRVFIYTVLPSGVVTTNELEGGHFYDGYGSSVAAGDNVVAAGIDGYYGEDCVSTYLFGQTESGWDSLQPICASGEAKSLAANGCDLIASLTSGGGIVVYSLTKPPVVLIPGIAGSDLELGNELLWPSIQGENLERLGLSSAQAGIKAVDITRSYTLFKLFGYRIGHFPVYDPLIEHLTNGMGYIEFPLNGDLERMTSGVMLQETNRRPNLFIFPYDWRQSNSVHIANLRKYISDIRKLHYGDPVVAVAHSMGGLILRRYILEEQSDADFVKCVTMGTPYWGAPVAIYRMLTGNFLDKFGDFMIRPALYKALRTMPGMHELLPSERYSTAVQGPLFVEDDADWNGNGRDEDAYDRTQLASALDEWARPNKPMANSDVFHNYGSGLQDDLSTDTPSKYVHIISANQPETVTQVVAEAVSEQCVCKDHDIYRVEYGDGDGTVPTTSARANAGVTTLNMLAPGKNTKHMDMPANSQVWRVIDSVIGGTYTYLPPLPSVWSLATNNANPRRIEVRILGRDYVTIVDGAGYTNERLSDVYIESMPDVEAIYGGDANWMSARFDEGHELVFSGIASNNSLSARITLYATNRSPVAVQQYYLSEPARAWKIIMTTNGWPPTFLYDQNADGQVTSNEIELATSLQDNSQGIDITAPKVSLSFQRMGTNILVTASVTDDQAASNTVIRYRLNGGAAEIYSGPLLMPIGPSAEILVNAVDAAGNYSGLMQTRIEPDVAVIPDSSSGFRVRWPRSDGYVLETAANPAGNWSAVAGPPEIIGNWRFVSFPGTTSAVFRLRYTNTP